MPDFGMRVVFIIHSEGHVNLSWIAGARCRVSGPAAAQRSEQVDLREGYGAVGGGKIALRRSQRALRVQHRQKVDPALALPG
jgi:hypothetical protein